jgi:hypothetical protein
MRIKVLFLFAVCASVGVVGLPLAAQKPKTSAPPRMAFGGRGGKAVAHGCVFTFVPGTELPLPSYADPEHKTINPNPVILDGKGSAAIFFDQPYNLKVVSKGGRNLRER